MAIGNNLPVGEKLIKDTTQKAEKEISEKVENQNSIKIVKKDEVQISLWLPRELVKKMKARAIEDDNFYSITVAKALENYLK
jgi:ApbE superfamily uncharacterized protein (UPF0280 family)